MGAVFLARRDDDEFEQEVALKLIKRGMDTDEILLRFRRERQILAGLEHTNIARLLDGGTTQDGLPYFVMEYVNGLPIGHFCREQKLDLTERLEIFRQVCSAVTYAHQHLVVHRDIKPSNILVTQDGTPKLLDFGIAKLISQDENQPQTVTQFAAMTPDYASPEQLHGEKITTATDVFSLGKVLAELVSDSNNAKPPRDLQAILHTALREEPEGRYKSVEQFSDDIDRYLKGLPVTAQTDSLGYRVSKFVGRNRIAVGAATAGIVLLAAGIFSVVSQGRIAAAERDKARTEAKKSDRINSFMQSVFGSADPRKVGKDVRVADTLDDAVLKAESELADQPEILASVRRTIGNSFQGLGLYEKAEAQLRFALETHENILGSEHPETLKSLRDLAILMRYKGDYENAAKTFESVVSLQKKNAPTKEDLVETLFEFGSTYFLAGKSDLAAPLFTECHELSLKVFGENNFYTAVSLNALGLVEEYRGDLDGAETLFRQAVEIYRKLPDKNRGECSLILLNLGTNLTTKKRYDEAEPFFRESIEQTIARFGQMHPATSGPLTHLGRMFMLKGDPAESEKLLRRALDIQRKTLPPDHPEIPQTSSLLGLVLTRSGRANEGETLIIEPLAVRKKILPADHWLIANLESALGECLTRQKRFAEAEVEALKGFEGLKAKLGEKHPRTVEAAERLVTLYSDWAKPAEKNRYVALTAKLE